MAPRSSMVFTCALALALGCGEESSMDDDIGDSDETGDVCPTPLPPEAFNGENELAFGIFFGGLELEVGTSLDLDVGLSQCCVFWEPLPTCSVYSVEPENAGATIDPDTGLLTLAADVVDGTEFTVTANVEDGLAIVEDTVFAYQPELHPLEGFWYEVGRIQCGGGAEFTPTDPINELRFTASGQLGVTWMPVEVYTDYWGDYVADMDAGTLSLSNIAGNFIPDDIDGEGLFSFEGDELVLEDMWLGHSLASLDPPACGHRFAK